MSVLMSSTLATITKKFEAETLFLSLFTIFDQNDCLKLSLYANNLAL